MRRAFCILLVPALLLAGCKKKDPTRPGYSLGAHVTGVVSLNGRPVAGATVSTRQGAVAVTDADGAYCIEAPAFTDVELVVRYVPGERRAVDYYGSATVQTGDLSTCEDAAVQNIELRGTPI